MGTEENIFLEKTVNNEAATALCPSTIYINYSVNINTFLNVVIAVEFFRFLW